jgi:hypothetical protein
LLLLLQPLLFWLVEPGLGSQRKSGAGGGRGMDDDNDASLNQKLVELVVVVAADDFLMFSRPTKAEPPAQKLHHHSDAPVQEIRHRPAPRDGSRTALAWRR